MGFEFIFFVYLLSYILFYVLWIIVKANYIEKYKPGVDIKDYLTISVGRYYVQRFIINWIILILSINNLIDYNSDYGSAALFCFFVLVGGEIFVFFEDGTVDKNGNFVGPEASGADCLVFYFNFKLNNLFTLINKFKINKKDQINE